MAPASETQPEITIRPFREDDWPYLWPILRDTIRAGETYAIERQTTEAGARDLWVDTPRGTYVAEIDGRVLGTYYIRVNKKGGGAHVCNAGYIVSPKAQGRGIARAMCAHSLGEARSMGYKAMQFNLVVSTNTRAIAVWEDLGFDVVGRLPRAFEHPTLGLVDALVMYQWLADD